MYQSARLRSPALPTNCQQQKMLPFWCVTQLWAAGQKAPATAAAAAVPAASPSEQKGAQSRSSFSFNASKAKAAAAAPAPAAPVFEYDILHQARTDLSETWSDRRTCQASARPSALVVRIKMPVVTTASAISLTTSARGLSVSHSDKMLDIALPYDVEAETSSAKFDKHKGQLEVRLVVVQLARTLDSLPPPDGEDAAAKEEAHAHDADASQTTERTAHSTADCAGGSFEGGGEGASMMPELGGSITDNEAKWREVHASQAAASPLPQQAEASIRDETVADEDAPPRNAAAAADHAHAVGALSQLLASTVEACGASTQATVVGVARTVLPPRLRAVEDIVLE